MLITGGIGAEKSAEIYHPDRDSACVLQDLSDRHIGHIGHTQDGSLLCGGWVTPRSCRRWNPDTGAWDLVTESLTEDRGIHSSWTPADGSVTYLMGGLWSTNSSDFIGNDNVVRASFPMEHNTV